MNAIITYQNSVSPYHLTAIKFIILQDHQFKPCKTSADCRAGELLYPYNTTTIAIMAPVGTAPLQNLIMTLHATISKGTKAASKTKKFHPAANYKSVRLLDYGNRMQSYPEGFVYKTTSKSNKR
jgi:hypothetical protein